jgi:hypothetical protein
LNLSIFIHFKATYHGDIRIQLVNKCVRKLNSKMRSDSQ